MVKCKFYKDCSFADEDSPTCKKNGGMYYEDGSKPAGCYRRLEEIKFKQEAKNE